MKKTLSEIQNRILAKFLRADSLRYSQARPKKIENDLYNYHLQQLRKNNFLEKKGDKYRLSQKGKKYVLQMDVSGEMKSKFKLSVLSFLTREQNGQREILLQKRLRQPYFGDVQTVAGKVLPGEYPLEAAKRRLEQETGLVAEFKLMGMLRAIRRNKDKEVIDDTMFHICYSEELLGGELIEKNLHGMNFWSTFKDALNYQKKNKTASSESEEVLKKLRDREFDMVYLIEDIVVEEFV